MLMLHADDGRPAEGWLFVYACRHAFVPHVESAVAAVLGQQQVWQWWEQPHVPAAGSHSRYVRADVRWRGNSSAGSRLASVLRTFPDLFAEVVAQPTPTELGRRYLLVPALGLWSAAVDDVGESVVTEQQLRAGCGDSTDWPTAIAQLFGHQWEESLAPLRQAPRVHAASLLRVV